MPGPLLIGRHTRAIAAALDLAVERFISGASTFLDIAVPFRHGKSDLVSRAFPAYFLGRCAELQPDVIQSGYGADLVEGFSRDVKRIIGGDRYRVLFPGIQLARGSNNVGSWSVAGSTGKVTVAGLGGAITGKGGHLIVVDDYCKSRAEALSEAYRRRTWDSFRADLLTRRAPASIVIVCATPWHVQDLRGMIRSEMAENPDFPRFDRLQFPARDPGGEYLFPERFAPEWYRQQYAMLGRLAAGLLDCAPTLEGGNRFQVEVGRNVIIHDSIDDFPKTRYVRAWDLASSSKQRDKDDPDSTVGELGTVTTNNGVSALWIKDAAYIQAEAPRRDALIQSTARKDGAGVAQLVEAFGGYKDAFTTLQAVLRGVSVVHPSHLPGDKSAKLAPLEPIFDAGNVHLLKAPWNDLFLRQFQEFPDGAHDDWCDPAAIVYHAFAKQGSGFL